jgi:hypothetical protein
MVRFLRRIAPFTSLALLVALGYLGWEFLSRSRAERRSEAQLKEKQASAYRGYGQAGGSGVKILQFYAAPAVLMEGQTAILCYGVSNATSVRIEPGVEPVSPSMNRCLAINPEETTRYALTATGAGGETESASFVMQVEADPDRLPQILYFLKGRKQKEGGRTLYTLCFETRNAALVSVEPRAFSPGPLFRGCFYAAPPATTTYKLTVADAKGRKVQREVTLTVP